MLSIKHYMFASVYTDTIIAIHDVNKNNDALNNEWANLI